MKYKILMMFIMLIGLIVIPNTSIKAAQGDTYMYRWYEIDEFTCNKLSNELGIDIKRISKGMLIEGYTKDGLPITKQGIEIVFGSQPTIDQLESVDLALPDYKRVGGKSAINIIIDRLDAVETDVDNLKQISTK